MEKARFDDEESVEVAFDTSSRNTEQKLDNLEENEINVEDNSVNGGDDIAGEATAVDDDFNSSPRQVHNKIHASSHPKPSNTR